MHNEFSDNLWGILACPSCGKSLERTKKGALCNSCGFDYEYTDSGSLDLRLKQPKKFQYEFELGNTLFPEAEFKFDTLSQNNIPQVDFADIDVPWHLTNEIMSYFPKAIGEGRA